MSKESSDKPVAWRTKNKWNAWVATTSDLVASGWADSGREVEPLYSAALRRSHDEAQEIKQAHDDLK